MPRQFDPVVSDRLPLRGGRRKEPHIIAPGQWLGRNPVREIVERVDGKNDIFGFQHLRKCASPSDQRVSVLAEALPFLRRLDGNRRTVFPLGDENPGLLKSLPDGRNPSPDGLPGVRHIVKDARGLFPVDASNKTFDAGLIIFRIENTAGEHEMARNKMTLSVPQDHQDLDVSDRRVRTGA